MVLAFDGGLDIYYLTLFDASKSSDHHHLFDGFGRIKSRIYGLSLHLTSKAPENQQMKVLIYGDTSPIFIGEVLVSGSVQPISTGGLTGEVWSINSFDEVSITAFLDPPWSLRKTGARKIFKQFFLPAIYIESSDFLIGSKEGWLLDFLRCKTGHKTQFWKVACFIPRGDLRMWCFKLWPFMTLELSLVKNCVVY